MNEITDGSSAFGYGGSILLGHTRSNRVVSLSEVEATERIAK